MYVFVVDVYVLTCLNVYNTSTFMCFFSYSYVMQHTIRVPMSFIKNVMIGIYCHDIENQFSICLTSGNIRNENMFFFLEGEMKIC